MPGIGIPWLVIWLLEVKKKRVYSYAKERYLHYFAKAGASGASAGAKSLCGSGPVDVTSGAPNRSLPLKGMMIAGQSTSTTSLTWPSSRPVCGLTSFPLVGTPAPVSGLDSVLAPLFLFRLDRHVVGRTASLMGPGATRPTTAPKLIKPTFEIPLGNGEGEAASEERCRREWGRHFAHRYI